MSPFVRNVLLVMTGSAVAQSIGFALSPIVSRLYTPEDFGAFGSFSSVAGIIAAAATLEYTQAVVVPRDEADGFSLFVVSCMATCAVSAATMVVFLAAPALLTGTAAISGGLGALLMVAATLAAGFNKSLQAWCVRVKAFKHTSAAQVVRSVSSTGTQIGFGLAHSGSMGLVVSSVLADIMASVNLFRAALPDLIRLRHAIYPAKLVALAREYRDFPLYAASQNVVNALSQGLPVLLLGQSYGIAVAGAYAFTIRILAAPQGLVTTALRQVLFQRAAETHHSGQSLRPLFVKATAGLFALGLLPTMVLVVWAPPLFAAVFGAEWLTAGEFGRSLTVWLLFAFCNLPAILFARLIRIQRLVFFFDLVTLLARSLTLVLGGIWLPAAGTVLAFAAVGVVSNIVLIGLVERMLRSGGQPAAEEQPGTPFAR